MVDEDQDSQDESTVDETPETESMDAQKSEAQNTSDSKDLTARAEAELDEATPKATNKTFRLVLAYVGGNYRGWQRQREDQEELKSSVAEQVEQAARKATGAEKVSLHGSGRTDAGVHARGQVAHLRCQTVLNADILYRAMNSFLPKDIRLLSLKEDSHSFHAQRDAESKRYRYFVLQNPKGVAQTSWPFLHGWTWYVPQELNIDLMIEALELFQGRKDFAAFQNVGTEQKETVRELFAADLFIHEHPYGVDFPWMPPAESGLRILEFSLHGSGFLKQMVRNIVGTVVEVGKGRFTVGEVAQILADKDRRNAGITAPAYGLFLDRVLYPSPE